jgi:hypothetical protein
MEQRAPTHNGQEKDRESLLAVWPFQKWFVIMRRRVMRILQVWIILLGVGLGVVGCTGGPPLVPVTDPTQRLEVEGLSILPPQGENWN